MEAKRPRIMPPAKPYGPNVTSPAKTYPHKISWEREKKHPWLMFPVLDGSHCSCGNIMCLVMYAIKNNSHVELLESLWDMSLEQYAFALSLAVVYDHFSAVKRIVKIAGRNSHVCIGITTTYTALALALNRGNIRISRYLLQKGWNPLLCGGPILDPKEMDIIDLMFKNDRVEEIAAIYEDSVHLGPIPCADIQRKILKKMITCHDDLRAKLIDALNLK